MNVAIAGKRHLIAVGRRIRARRLELGLSQRDLSGPGATYAYVSRIESGQRVPSLSVLIELAERLDTTGLELLTGDAHADCPLCGRSGKPEASSGGGSTSQIRSEDEEGPL